MAINKIPTFAVGTYASIQPSIISGVLEYPSYVFCSDTNTLVFIDKNKNIQNLKGYNQDSILIVDTLPTENIRNDAFYVCDGIGYLYINNIAVPMFKKTETTSYDDLENVPIVNKHGDYAIPLILAELDDGAYSVTGQYQIGGTLSTTYVTSAKSTFLIDSDEANQYITKISVKEIVMYTINKETGEGITSIYATEAWIEQKGYTTESYVNEAIREMYNKIVQELSITKVSQLENDAGYLTKDDINGIGIDSITNLF